MRAAWICAARAGGAHDFAQESAFAVVAFDAMDDGAGVVGELDRQHQAGEAGAGAEIDPSFRLRREGEQLRAIGDMARPDGREGRCRRSDWSPCAIGRAASTRESSAFGCFT